MKWIYKCSPAKNQDFMNMDRHKKKEKSKTILLSYFLKRQYYHWSKLQY